MSAQTIGGVMPKQLPAVVLVDELLGHLGAAKMQLIPSDDQRIADHIRAAHALATVLYRSLRP